MNHQSIITINYKQNDRTETTKVSYRKQKPILEITSTRYKNAKISASKQECHEYQDKAAKGGSVLSLQQPPNPKEQP